MRCERLYTGAFAGVFPRIHAQENAVPDIGFDWFKVRFCEVLLHFDEVSVFSDKPNQQQKWFKVAEQRHRC
jgi:hypothetical protein